MNPETTRLLLQLVVIASQLAPTVIAEIEGIRQQTGKTAEEIFSDAGVKLEANDAKALSILTGLMAPETLAES